MSPGTFFVRRGEGMPLVVIHGNGVDHRLLLPLDECFGDGRWERLYLDLPGFGRTPPRSEIAGLPDLAEWLVTTVRELVGERPFALLANSLGALLARHVAAQMEEQVTGLALIAPVVDPDPSRRTLAAFSVVQRDEALLKRMTNDDREEFTGIAARQTAESWEAFRDHALPGIRAADPETMVRLSRRYFLEEVPEDISAPFERPTVIVTGKQDHIVGYADQFHLLHHYSAATYAVLDGAGHNVHLEQPAAVSRLLRDWARHVQELSDVSD